MGPQHCRGGAGLSVDALSGLEDDATTRRGDRTLYLIGTGSWFASHGVQTVLFAWLVTVALRESPEKVGFAQSMMMLPMLCLLLVGGAASDHFGGARLARIAQGCALLPVFALALLLSADALVYGLLVVYALLMGTVGAFVTPARDGMLSQIAGRRIQRTVVLASFVQFGVQILGFQLAGLTDAIGPVPVLGTQIVILAAGALAFRRLERRLARTRAPAPAERPPLRAAIGEGLRAVLASRAMRSVALINALVGLFMMGAFQVGIPLLLREVHGGTPAQLAQVNTVHMIGVVATTLYLLRIGDVERRGRALLLGFLLGGAGLAGIGLADSFAWLLAFNLCWGVTGGLVMSMARTIMQESAPPELRGRVMAFFSLTFMGAGPLGAMLSGLLVEGVGVHLALVLPGFVVMAAGLVAILRSSLWTLQPTPG